MFDNSINNLIDEKYCDLTSQPGRTVNSLVELKRSGSICKFTKTDSITYKFTSSRDLPNPQFQIEA